MCVMASATRANSSSMLLLLRADNERTDDFRLSRCRGKIQRERKRAGMGCTFKFD